ncbi:hypothetical protein BS50DRAFT_586048 [Corynespora cassiicola Philippines]|uniref:Uncharacterized protein n=1 Tax=Corynespora cassiicola Philippines TaxID=1448308 RepID=A0A2T2NT92_CORCC|nr:hypothetical protein BS50DRAFT_586048 [Corynespora cassiicola Philippines]
MSESLPSTWPGALSSWRAYAHLYLPFLTSFLCIAFAPPNTSLLPVAASAIPTYLLGSLIYGTNPAPPPAERVRFTRQRFSYRVLVLFTYGRLLGTPLNLLYFAFDLFANYMLVPLLIREDVPRRSDLLVCVLWTTASGVLLMLVGHGGLLGLVVGSVDRTLWRATYLALVDGMISTLGRPDTVSSRGKITVVGVQVLLITLFTAWTRFRMTYSREELQSEPE